MIDVQLVAPQDKRAVGEFIDFPFRLYRGHPLWVPPIRQDVATQLNPQKHPFYEHSQAAAFLARRDGEVVGRIAVLEHRPHNRYHNLRRAQFYLLECVDDLEVAGALFARCFEWAHARGLDRMVGPKGFSPIDGYGLLVEGFAFRPAMTMMNYNHAYLPDLLARLGFEKEVDFVSCYLGGHRFRLPERVHRIAERVRRSGRLEVRSFRSRGELRAWAGRIGRAYNRAFVGNWEYYPLSDREIAFLSDNLLAVAVPRLVKIITHGEQVVGFLFAFPDVSAAIQRGGGRLRPWNILDLLCEMRRTQWVVINGAGILPEFQGRGGNALLYTEMERTVREAGFRHADLTQIAETAVQMRRDLENLGAIPYKNHRVYTRAI